MYIQQRAIDARPWDSLPPVFLGFDRFYFLHDPLGGAASIRVAAERLPFVKREALTTMAARWAEKGDDPRIAINMIDAMVKNIRDRDLRKNLEARMERLKGLAQLRDAAQTFSKAAGKPPAHIEELIGPGLLVQIPADPLGNGYTLDTRGVPVIASRKPSAK
jgi:hypothetical protein